MQNKLPFHLGRHLGRTAQGLQRHVSELRVEDDEGGVVGEEELGFEADVGGGAGGFEEVVDGSLVMRIWRSVYIRKRRERGEG